jgi:formate dehydrogenase maturation protein FdhE
MKNKVKSKYSEAESKNMLDNYFEFIANIIQTKNNNIENNNIENNNIENNNIENNNNSYYEVIKRTIYEYLEPSLAPSLHVPTSTEVKSNQTNNTMDITRVKYILLIFVIVILLLYVTIKYKSLVKMIKKFRK